MFGASALGRPRGMVWGGRREKCSGRGTHVYLWRIHFDIWQNQYNIVKLKNKIKLKKKKYECLSEGKEKRNENKEKYIYIQISNKVSDDTVQIGVITSSNR